MADRLTRRAFMLGVAASAAFSGLGTAQGDGYTITNYPYSPDGIFAQIGHRQVEMDVGLLHPQTGQATAGFYASLDATHGQPFGRPWQATYQRFFKWKDVHTTDKGTIIQVANHIRAHSVTVEQLTQAYNRAKDAWDRNPSLRAAGIKHLDVAEFKPN